MSALVNKTKQYISSLELGWSELFLALGFLFSVPYYAFAWKFMVTSDPADVLFKPWMIIVTMVGLASCWGIYFYLEAKKGNLKNNVFLWVYLFFAVFSIVTVLVQPSHSEILVEARFVNDISHQYYPGIEVGDLVPVVTVFSATHKLFFACASFVITTVFYIIYMIFPKRVKSMNFLILVGVIIFIFLLVLTGYSYIAEHANYGPFLKALFSGDVEGVYEYSVCSFVVHRVPYGACMMMGLMFALLLHSYTEKWYWYLPAGYCLINMVFSWCKSAIAFSIVVVLLYLVYRLFATFKNHKKRNIILGSIYGGIVLVVLSLVVVSAATEGKVIPQIYKLLSSFTDNRTINTRTFIWDNIIQRLNEGWWAIGRGFGTHNYMLYPMNLVNGDDVCPSHSSYFAVLGMGGIITLLAYIALHIYYGYIFYQCFKFDKYKTIGLSVGVVGFFMYSFTEGVNYLILVFMFPMFLYYYQIKRGVVTKEANA